MAMTKTRTDIPIPPTAQSPARPEGKGPVQVESLWLDFDGTLWNNQKACVRQLEFALRVLGIDGTRAPSG